MSIQKIPQALIACLALGVWSVSAFAQSGESRPRLLATNIGLTQLSSSLDEPVIVSTVPATTPKPTTRGVIDVTPNVKVVTDNFVKFQPLLLSAIDQRLGAPYSWGATGPRAFDCSGFVWSIFQEAGITFERESARRLFQRFAPATPDEQYKFGTLVFFSGLAHVGVVADEHGFYHASRHHGVIYSPFNDYWMSRIDGFRRVPLATIQATD